MLVYYVLTELTHVFRGLCRITSFEVYQDDAVGGNNNVFVWPVHFEFVYSQFVKNKALVEDVGKHAANIGLVCGREPVFEECTQNEFVDDKSIT